ncbi:MAG TPA: hypothetical protein VFR47_14450 [Anaerolineales bacterium]|nr:hypothetical protein [Anaerolineales bacterium]
MSESPKPRPRLDSSIIAALIGLLGTVTVTLISVFANRPVSPQATAVVEIPTLSGGAEVSELPAATAPATLPTVKYPDGKLFQLFYDDNSFYLLNLSETAIPINRVAFERLSTEDVPLNRFNGTRWAEFYPDSTPGKCVALEIVGSSPYLDPPECGQGVFLSLRTPTRDDPTIFWTANEGSHQFRVLWREGGQDEEIARCEIGVGICEVFLP